MSAQAAAQQPPAQQPMPSAQSMYVTAAPGTMMPWQSQGNVASEPFAYTAGYSFNDTGNVGYGKTVPTSLSTLAVGSPTGREYYICADVSQTTLFDNKEKLPPVPPLGHVYVWELAGWKMSDGTIKPISEATPQQCQTRPLWEAPPPMEEQPALPAPPQDQSQNHGYQTPYAQQQAYPGYDAYGSSGYGSAAGMFAPRPLPPVPNQAQQASQQAAQQQGGEGQSQPAAPMPWDQIPYPFVFPGAGADVAGRLFTQEECQMYGVPLGTCWKDAPPQAGSYPAFPSEGDRSSSMNAVYFPPAPVFPSQAAPPTAKSTVDEVIVPSTVQQEHSYHGPQPTANPDFLQTMWLQQQGSAGQGYGGATGAGLYNSGYGNADAGAMYSSGYGISNGYGISSSSNTQTQYNAGVGMTSMSTQFNGPYNGQLSVGVGTEVAKGKYSYA